jgi:hypothetical protein
LDNLGKITEWSVRVMDNRKQCLKDIQDAAERIKDQIKSIRSRVNAILDMLDLVHLSKMDFWTPSFLVLPLHRSLLPV